MTTEEREEKERIANEQRTRDEQADRDRLANEQRARDVEAEEARANNVTVNNPRAPEAVAKQHEQVDAEKAKRNEENREGHERNMQAIENEAAQAQARTEHADDPRAGHVPTGKEQNRNTPRVLPDGTKVWDK